MRQITTHKATPEEKVEIFCTDEPGSGGACHNYHITSSATNGAFVPVNITFQNGPIPQNGVNGVTNETLLAIVRDRLEKFQEGPFACDENEIALNRVCKAMEILHARTTKRIARGVEGKLIK